MSRIFRTAISLFMVAVIGLTAIPASVSAIALEEETDTAQDSTLAGENITWTLEDGTLTLNGTGATWDYRLSDNTRNWDSKQVKNIVIGTGITELGNYLFSFCTNAETVTIPDTVTVIKEGCFNYCRKLNRVTISEGVTEMGFGVFFQCAGLTEITLPKSMKKVGASVFYECNNLRKITVLNPDCNINSSSSAMGVKEIVTIYGYSNSTAQAFAEKNDYRFVALDTLQLGDVNGDSEINASDASEILIASAKIGSEGVSDLTPEQFTAGDVNNDDDIDVDDAVTILIYSTKVGAGDENVVLGE